VRVLVRGETALNAERNAREISGGENARRRRDSGDESRKEEREGNATAAMRAKEKSA
jgi:hypothetical protein